VLHPPPNAAEQQQKSKNYMVWCSQWSHIPEKTEIEKVNYIVKIALASIFATLLAACTAPTQRAVPEAQEALRPQHM
jgi:hypothetical protein